MAKSITKLEVIVDYVQLENVATGLEGAGFTNYTIIREVQGSGGRGHRRGDGLTGEFSNSYVLIAAKEKDVDKIIKIVDPYIKKFGGIILISEAKIIEY